MVNFEVSATLLRGVQKRDQFHQSLCEGTARRLTAASCAWPASVRIGRIAHVSHLVMPNNTGDADTEIV
jgi:hypothetical protein